MRWLLVGAIAALPTRGVADDVKTDIATVRWPDLPADSTESLQNQVVDHLSAIGDQIGVGLDDMSGHLLTLSVDGRHSRARLGIGYDGGERHYLTFRIDSHWLFEHGAAHIDATLHLGVGSHDVYLKLPGMVLRPDSYRGQDMVVFDVNLLERRF